MTGSTDTLVKGYTFRFSIGIENIFECDQCGALISGPSAVLNKHTNFHSLLSVLLNTTVI